MNEVLGFDGDRVNSARGPLSDLLAELQQWTAAARAALNRLVGAVPEDDGTDDIGEQIRQIVKNFESLVAQCTAAVEAALKGPADGLEKVLGVADKTEDGATKAATWGQEGPGPVVAPGPGVTHGSTGGRR